VGSGPFPTELHDEKGEELRKIGSEFGATTGRPRRCGWIDLVALKYTCMINGVTQIIMTKADILDSFKELELGIAYEMEGKQIDYVPFQLVGTPVTPIWKKMAGWEVDTTKMKNDAELPATMKTYIKFINEYLGVPVKYVSNGPGRDQIVHL
jgi:adenylosuccinate synthase